MEIELKICPICKKEFSSRVSAKRKYCSRKCYKVGYSKIMKGRKAWNKGLTKEDPRVRKIIESRIGISPPIKGKTYEEYYGKEKARQLKENHSKILKGKFIREKNPFWKGDKATSKGAYHQRARTYKKGYCEICKKMKHEIKNGRLEVHHKDGDIKNNNPKNLQTLCNRCHQIVDNRINMKRDWHGRICGR